jgi:hypothetical protein
MKKKLTYGILLVVISSSLSSCGIKGSGNVVKMERTVTEFNSVEAYGGLAVYIKQDSIYKVEVRADDNLLPHIKTHVSGNTLVVKTDLHRRIKKYTALEVYISSPSFEKIDLKGSGDVQGVNRIQASSIQLALTGSGNMKFDIQSTNADVSITGSGNVNVDGTSDNLTAGISGSGNIDGYNLIAKTADAHISGSGDITLNVQNDLNARISGSGNISYIGKPAVRISISGSGKVSGQ